MIAAMKVLILIAALLFLFPSPVLCVRAEEAASPAAEVYAVAARNDVWLYAEENEESGLFLLPYTYYVRVEERGEEFSSVVYGTDEAPYRAVHGYCKTEMLTFVGFIPERPFLKLEVTLTYTVPGTSSEMGNGTFDEIERTFHYYGTSYLGTQRYFYVLSDGVFDYIPAARDVNYELNTDYLTDVSAPAEELPVEEESSSALSGIEIAALILGILAVAAIAFFVLRGRKAPSAAAEGEEF